MSSQQPESILTSERPRRVADSDVYVVGEPTFEKSVQYKRLADDSPVFVCAYTKLQLAVAFLFEGKAFFDPVVAYLYYFKRLVEGPAQQASIKHCKDVVSKTGADLKTIAQASADLEDVPMSEFALRTPQYASTLTSAHDYALAHPLEKRKKAKKEREVWNIYLLPAVADEEIECLRILKEETDLAKFNSLIYDIAADSPSENSSFVVIDGRPCLVFNNRNSSTLPCPDLASIGLGDRFSGECLVLSTTRISLFDQKIESEEDNVEEEEAVSKKTAPKKEKVKKPPKTPEEKKAEQKRRIENDKEKLLGLFVKRQKTSESSQ